jgi:hypothetical protein
MENPVAKVKDLSPGLNKGLMVARALKEVKIMGRKSGVCKQKGYKTIQSEQNNEV